MLKPTIRLVCFACLLAASGAANEPFIGKWKLKLADRMTIAPVGGNRYTLNFAVGETETVAADGTEHPRCDI
jgi:hypothetical protein